MPEEPKITMTEFKVVFEDLKSDVKKVAEGVSSLQRKVEDGFQYMHQEFHSVKEQIALLHEGQTEIKSRLKQKVDRE